MDKLSQITLENTVSIKVDCLLNQQLLAKNFGIIMQCLKDLKTQQDKHSSMINQLPNLQDLFQKFKNQINSKLSDFQKSNKIIQSQKNNIQGSSKQSVRKQSNNNISINNQKQIHQNNKSQNKDLRKQIQQIKARLLKNEGFTNDNTKDINLLNKDMKEVKEQIQNLKQMIKNIPSGNQGQNGKFNNLELAKNPNVQQQSINNLNKASQQNTNSIKKMEKQIKQMKDKIQQLKGLIDLNNDIKNNNNNNATQINNNSNSDNNNSNADNKVFNDLVKKVQYLTKKADSLQNQSNEHSKNINNLSENVDKNSQEINDTKQNINGIHQEIQEINKILEQLQNVHNEDINNLLSQIERLKEMIQKIMKGLNEKNKEKNEAKHQDSNSSIQGHSSKNLHRGLNDRSFRRRADSNAKEDLNGKINELISRIAYLEKMLASKLSSQQNPEKLPSVHKKQNMTFYNGQKSSHKKQLGQLKNQLEIWIKSYLNNINKNSPNLSDLQLKIQEIRNALNKKADHQGMKKGLAFLQGKITQLYLFLTQPDAEDAMIVRKGFNCLSCSKKVETLRGKLGPRMNWDNLNVNNHTPPKNGFPKYADSNERDSI